MDDMRRKAMPPQIIISQFAQRQLVYWVTKPPMMGPNTGPFIGPMLHIEKTRARYSSETMSPMVPGAFAIHADPAIAPKRRTTMIVVMFFARAHGMTRMKKQERAIT